MFNGSKIKLIVSTGLAVAGLGIASLASVSASAANTGSTTANVAVGQTITLSGLTSAFTLSGVPGATATGSSAVTMNVKTNDNLGYTVTVLAAAANMKGTGTNLDVIPVSSLTVKNSAGAVYTPLSNITPVTTATTTVKTTGLGDAVSNDYQIVNIPWVNADTYSVTLNYVANGN